MVIWNEGTEADKEANMRGARMILEEIAKARESDLLVKSKLSGSKLTYFDVLNPNGCTVEVNQQMYTNIISIRLEPPCGKIMLYTSDGHKQFEATPKELHSIKISG
jgi:hypothetical protein